MWYYEKFTYQSYLKVEMRLNLWWDIDTVGSRPG